MAVAEKERTSELIPTGREKDFREIAAPNEKIRRDLIDESAMYIRPLAIVSGAEDRDGEVTNPDGLIDTAYRQNPVVFLNHSHRIAPMTPPVGQAQKPDWSYDCFRDGDRWYSGCRFSQATKFATQVFALIAEGMLNARSIGALNHGLKPYKPKAPGVAFHKGRIVPVKTASVEHSLFELLEWSWVWIPSNREMTIAMKSLTHRDRFDGQAWDTDLRHILESTPGMSEPANSNQKRSWTRHSNAATWLQKSLTSGGSQMPGAFPVAVRFSTKQYTPAKAKQWLRDHDELLDTELSIETVGDSQFLRSTQVTFDGDVKPMTDARAPGVEFLFAKAFMDDEDSEGKDDKEKRSVEDIVEEAIDDSVVVDEDDDMKDPEEKNATGPRGSQHLKQLVKHLYKLLKMEEAAAGDLEPELMSKCGEIREMLTGVIGEIKKFHRSRYEATDETEEESAETGGDGDSTKKDEEPEETMEKSIDRMTLTKMFFGEKKALPSGFIKAVKSAHEAKEPAQTKAILGQVLKGFLPRATVASDDAGTESAAAQERALQERLKSIQLRRQLLKNK